MNDFAGSADQIAKQLVAGGMEPDRAMMMALRMAQSRQQADESILGGVPTQPPTSDVPPATEILGGDPSRLFQRQPTTMERVRDLPKDVLGAGEALVSMGSLAALAPASMLYALRPGQKTQGDPMEFALRNMYMPRSERGPSHLAGLGEVLESLPQTGPLPELQAFTGVGRGVGRQLAEKGRQAGRAMAPAAANVAEDILSRQGLLMQAAPSGPTRVEAPASPLGFYDPVHQAALNIQRKQGPGQAFLNELQRSENVNKEFLEASGLAEKLRTTPNITREEVQNLAKGAVPEIQEVVKGQKGYQEAKVIAAQDIGETIQAGLGYFDDDHQALLNRWRSSPRGSAEERQAASTLEALLRQSGENRGVNDYIDAGAAQTVNTKYAQYQLPGGENYREVLLTIPSKQERDFAWEWFDPATQQSKQFATRDAALLDKPLGAVVQKVQSAERNKDYKSAHWDEPNVVSHIRMNDRTDADGKKVLFIEEIQSDWAQEGRKKGFNTGQTAPAGWADIANARSTGNVPSAPFVTNTKEWVDLSLKNIIKRAVDEGYDRVAFINGTQSADRYDLSKKVDELLYKKNADGTYKLSAQAQNRGHMLGDAISEDKLSDYVGTDVSKLIIEGSGKTVNLGGIGSVSQPKDEWQSLSGMSLRVGGEGMKAFYDKLVPERVNAILKRFGGGKTTPVQFQVAPASSLYPDKTSLRETITQPGFDITPAMRERFQKPIPYKQGGSVNHKAVASARRALEKAMAKGGIAKAAGKAAAKAAVKTEQRGLDLERLKTTGIEVPEAGFSKEDKAVLRPLYNQGLIRVEERDGKKILVPGKGAWYEFATPEQRTRLDALQESQGVKDLSLMGPTESLLNSAQASFYDFEIVPGVRNVPIQSLEPLLPGYESAQEMKRIQNLANQIKESKQIEPLFIGVDPTGIPYIMEGQHRIRALKSLGYEDVPARIVVDMDDVEKAAGGSVKMAGGGSVIGKAAAAAAKQAKAVLSPAESQANLQKMLAESQVKDRLYHGASADIDRFKSKSGEPVFLSPDPNFASKFALDDMLYGASSSDSGPVKSGANVMPVYAQVKNPFDYENPKHIRSVMSRLDHRDKKAFKESAVKGSWQEIEKHLGSIEDSGFDSVFVSEMGRKNLAVFDPKKIKSAIGNQGTYDITSPELNKAHGGLAHMAGGGSMLGRAAKAGAKAAKAAKSDDEKTLPMVLQRAPAKTKQELQAEAERVGRQIIGEHVTKPGDTANLADYSKKVSERLRAMQEGQDYVLKETRPTSPLANIDPATGSILIGLPGDISIADKELMKLGKLKVGSKQEGGPRYGAAYMDDPVEMAKFWASNYGPANIFQNKVTELGGMYPERDILGAYMSMGRTGMNFAQHFADANLKAIRSAIKAGDVSKDDIESFNKMIREGWSKINQKTGEREYFKYPDFAGVEKTGEAYAQMMRDPELRKWFNDRMKTGKETAPRGLPSGLDIEHAISEPELRNLEHSLVGFSLGRMQPGRELIAPVEHATYSHGIPGQAVGRLAGHVPARIAFPDASKVIAETKRPQDFTGTIQKVFPHQVVDQQWQDEVGQYLDYLKRITGRKKGGLMKKSSKLPKVIKSGKVGGLSALRK